MKKILLSLAASAVSLVAVAQSQRLVLVEHFTQASCGPCAAANPTLAATLSANSTKAIAIKHQTSWPGRDPMNAQYPQGPQARVTFYGITGVPDASLDGGATDAPNTAVTTAKINTRYAVASPFTVSVTHSLNSTYSMVNVTVNVTCTQAVTGADMRMRAAVVERNITFATAPGTNGETSFNNVLKQFLPNTAGEDLPETWTVGQTASYTYSWPIVNFYNVGELAVVAYIQDHGSKEVHQSGYSAPQPITATLPSLSAVGATVAAAGLCDYNITPTVTIRNTGTLPVTSCVASYTIGTNAPVTTTWTGNLAAGASTNIRFPVAQIASGVSSVRYLVSDANNAGELNTVDNLTAIATYTRLGQTASTTPPTEGFESYAAGDEPTGNMLVAETANYAFVASRALATTIPNDLGGFALTSNSLFFDCFSATNGYIMDALFNKVDLSNTPTGSSITFSYAHKQYSAAENERMELRVSTNCGQTWTSLWNKAGATLTTSTGYATARFWPTATEWATGSADISNYVGRPEVVFSFKVTSAYGQHVFLDDVVLATPTGVEELTFAETMKGFPNPANNEFNLEFDLETSTDVRMSVVDVLGREVMGVPAQSFGQGKQMATLNVSGLANGAYFLNIYADGKMSTRRFSVAH